MSSDPASSVLAAAPELKTLSMEHGVLAYRESGSGNTIFFLHGMNGQSASWLHQFTDLAHDHHVIAWDAPGYGGSDPCDPSIDMLADTAHKLIATLGARRPLLVGHSMGGVIAGRMAIKYPEAYCGLVLSCSHPGWGEETGQPLKPRYANRIRELNEMGPDAFARLRASRMVDENTDPVVLEFLAEVSKSITTEAIESVGRANQEADNLPGLAELEVPLYVVYAERDHVIKRPRTEEMLGSLPQARAIMLPGVGHAPYVEDPAGYNRVIRSIAKELFS